MCDRIEFGAGGHGFICGIRRRKVKCRCGLVAAWECDGCDRPLCGKCRIHVPPDKDFCKMRSCREAAAAAAAQLRLEFGR